jgi:hypothetical protein
MSKFWLNKPKLSNKPKYGSKNETALIENLPKMSNYGKTTTTALFNRKKKLHKNSIEKHLNLERKINFVRIYLIELEDWKEKYWR